MSEDSPQYTAPNLPEIGIDDMIRHHLHRCMNEILAIEQILSDLKARNSKQVDPLDAAVADYKSRDGDRT